MKSGPYGIKNQLLDPLGGKHASLFALYIYTPTLVQQVKFIQQLEWVGRLRILTKSANVPKIVEIK